jgi:hypothetical protein
VVRVATEVPVQGVETAVLEGLDFTETNSSLRKQQFSEHPYAAVQFRGEVEAAGMAVKEELGAEEQAVTGGLLLGLPS